MPRIPEKAQTEGSSNFDPDKYFETWGDEVLQPLYNNNFRMFIGKSFGLQPSDTYTYKAVAEVTLLQAQTYLEYGAQGGLHGWYKDTEGKLVSSSFFSTCLQTACSYALHSIREMSINMHETNTCTRSYHHPRQ